MGPSSILQYGERFGAEVKKIAAASPAAAEPEGPLEVHASARYTRWFHGESGEPEPMATSVRKFRPVTAEMKVEEVMAVTKDNLSILGGDASDLFFAKLPVEHRLRRAIRSQLLPGIPHLGTCKFGEVVTGQGADGLSVTQVFIANFDGNLDTSGDGTRLYRPLSKDFDQMFFGLHLLVDRNGNPIGFNRALGCEGIAFKTKDIRTALFNIAAASTGLSPQALQARANGRRMGR